MNQEEKKIEQECCRIARLNGWDAVKLEKNGHTGVPDRIFLHPSGGWFFVEFKKNKTAKRRELQNVWAEKYANFHFFVWNIDDFKNILAQKKNLKSLQKA